MVYSILSQLIVLLHFAFILFVIFGAFLVLRWHKIAWIHIPFALWGMGVEYFNIICPLTPWENHFRQLAGSTVYESGFIEHYIIPLMYPEVLSRNLQFILGSIVLIINGLIYGIVICRALKKQKADKNPAV